MNAKKIYNLELEETLEEVNLIALHSSMECYQLAFYLNNTINSNFKRSKNDLSIKDAKNNFIHFEWEDEMYDFQCSLFSNKCHDELKPKKLIPNYLFNLPVRNEVYLSPELKQVDFFIKSSDQKTIETVLLNLKKWSKISLLYQVDSEVIKKQLNVIFD
tara:strand:- start:482 stop:958 length:477 start_codon:yes stop_codon:yes gene_type:complete